MAPKEHLQELREQIRAAGDGADRLRFAIGVFLVLSLLPVLGLGVSGPLWFAVGAAVLMVAPALVALPLAVAYRSRLQRRLREAVGSLSVTERAELLAPLRQDPTRDTRKIAVSLMREFGVAAEVSPAVSPDGRGAEPSPAEQR